MRTVRTALIGFLLVAAYPVFSEEEKSPNGTLKPFEPTREELYQQFTNELRVVAGAEEHTKRVYTKVAEDMRQAVSFTFLNKLQGLMDSVGATVEDVISIAENVGNTEVVTSCTVDKDKEAENLVRSAVDDMRHCVEQMTAEGAKFAEDIAGVVTKLEDLLKQLVTATEECLSENSESSGEEKEQVMACLRSDSVKELLRRKNEAFEPLNDIMQKVFVAEKQPPGCIEEYYQRTDDEILELKKSITRCVAQIDRNEL